MPTITQLEYLLAVHQHGHFGRAAEALGVSQPTLSAQIQRAEDELGVVVFDRQTRPIEATERGRLIIERGRDVVAAHRRLIALAAGDFARPAGPFALGVIPTLAPYTLPWFLQRFAADHPEVELSLFERPTAELISAIRHNQLDAAILSTPLDEPSIEERALFYDPFYLYANAGEPLLDDLEVDVESLDPQKLWLLEDGHCFRAQMLSFCGVAERVHLGSVRFAAGSFETIRHLIDASEGYTLIPETYARTLSPATRRRSVRAFEARTPTREVSLVHHRHSAKLDITAALEAAIHAHIPRALARVDADGEILPISA